MFQDSWTLYDDEPAYPKKWIFHPRKRSIAKPVFGLFTIVCAVLVLFEIFSRV